MRRGAAPARASPRPRLPRASPRTTRPAGWASAGRWPAPTCPRPVTADGQITVAWTPLPSSSLLSDIEKPTRPALAVLYTALNGTGLIAGHRGDVDRRGRAARARMPGSSSRVSSIAPSRLTSSAWRISSGLEVGVLAGLLDAGVVDEDVGTWPTRSQWATMRSTVVRVADVGDERMAGQTLAEREQARGVDVDEHQHARPAGPGRWRWWSPGRRPPR